MKTLFTFWIILGCFFAGTYASAECSEIRLDKEGGSLENVPVLDQGSTNTCYSQAASVMVDAWRFKHEDKDYNHLTSPKALIFGYRQNGWKADSVDFGHTKDAINYVFEEKSCSRIITNEGDSKATEDPRNNSDIYQDLTRYYQMHKKLNSPVAMPEEVKELITAKINEADIKIDPNCKPRFNSLKEVLNISSSVNNALKAKDEYHYLKQINDIICQEPFAKKVKPRGVAKKVYRGKANANAIFLKIDNELEKGVPTTASYCSSMLRKKGYKGLFLNECMNKDSHASVIAGRRQSSAGTCEYLIRNSWGSSCAHYPDRDCENGSVWVSKADLEANISAVTHIEDISLEEAKRKISKGESLKPLLDDFQKSTDLNAENINEVSMLLVTVSKNEKLTQSEILEIARMLEFAKVPVPNIKQIVENTASNKTVDHGGLANLASRLMEDKKSYPEKSDVVFDLLEKMDLSKTDASWKNNSKILESKVKNFEGSSVRKRKYLKRIRKYMKENGIESYDW